MSVSCKQILICMDPDPPHWQSGEAVVDNCSCGVNYLLIHPQGLQYIHSKQLVHLDIKPGNIFISLEYITPSPPRK